MCIHKLRHWITLICLIVFLAPVHSVKAALILSGTRVIFPAGETSVSVKVDNPTDNDFLMQSWIEGSDGKVQAKLIVEPPIAQIKGHHKVELRISLVEPLLKKSINEQVFWLNVKEIPRVSDSQDSSALMLAMQTKIKVFYRPESVPSEMADAWKNLQWKYQGEHLILVNPTPYFITINKALAENNNSLAIDMVPPQSSTVINNKVSARIHNVSYDIISDYGDVSEKKTSSVR